MQGLKGLVSPSARFENGDEKEMRLIKYFRRCKNSARLCAGFLFVVVRFVVGQHTVHTESELCAGEPRRPVEPTSAEHHCHDCMPRMQVRSMWVVGALGGLPSDHLYCAADGPEASTSLHRPRHRRHRADRP